MSLVAASPLWSGGTSDSSAKKKTASRTKMLLPSNPASTTFAHKIKTGLHRTFKCAVAILINEQIPSWMIGHARGIVDVIELRKSCNGMSAQIGNGVG